MKEYTADMLLEVPRARIHKNPEYKTIKLYLQDKQLFGVEHSCNVRLAGEYYRAGILDGEMDAGDRELIFHFILNNGMTIGELNRTIASVHSEILLKQKKSLSQDIVACGVMELLMDDVLDNQQVASKYIKQATKIQPRHLWRFATPQEYRDYNVDIIESHHNGIPVAAYQLEKDIRYYEWLADTSLNGARQWVKDRLDANLYHINDIVRDYDVPVYLLAYQKHGVAVEKTVICGKVETDGTYTVGREIPRDIFKQSRAALK